MFQFTRLMLIVLGISAIVIGLMNFLIGPHSTANFFGNIFTSLMGSTGYSGGLDDANIDSEMRFYSVFWMAYGVSLFWLASNIVQLQNWVFAGLGFFYGRCWPLNIIRHCRSTRPIVCDPHGNRTCWADEHRGCLRSSP